LKFVALRGRHVGELQRDSRFDPWLATGLLIDFGKELLLEDLFRRIVEHGVRAVLKLPRAECMSRARSPSDLHEVIGEIALSQQVGSESLCGLGKRRVQNFCRRLRHFGGNMSSDWRSTHFQHCPCRFRSQNDGGKRRLNTESLPGSLQTSIDPSCFFKIP